MKRFSFSRPTGSLLLLALVCALLTACSTDKTMFLYVGTYSDGFYAYEFDCGQGAVVSAGPYAEAPGALAKAVMPNPSYLTAFGSYVYAVSEMPDSTAAVRAWHFDGKSFTDLGGQATGLPGLCEDPCYVATDGKYLAVANYSGGTLAVYSLLDNGGIAPLDTLVVSRAGGPDLVRQATPHVHCAVFTPDEQYLLFSEFSADAIGMLVLESGLGSVETAAELPADFGPRHLLFDADGTHLYVIGELSGDIVVFDYADGMLTDKQRIKADAVDARGAADIHLSPDGKFLYASLRLQNDGIAIFRVADDGTLTPAGYQHTGIHPRNFNITPDGRWMLVCCRDDNAIEIYRRDTASGQLTDTGRRITLSRPVFAGW